MHLRFSEDARHDLRQIDTYIRSESPQGAQRVITAILTSVSHLENFPLLGGNGRVDGTRELVVPRVPYVIVYSLPDEYHIDIERVLHTALQFPPE